MRPRLYWLLAARWLQLKPLQGVVIFIIPGVLKSQFPFSIRTNDSVLAVSFIALFPFRLEEVQTQ